jgi:hypothetical protein
MGSGDFPRFLYHNDFVTCVTWLPNQRHCGGTPFGRGLVPSPEGDSPRYGSAFPTLTRGASICRRCAAGGVVARRLSSCDQSSWDALRQGMAVRFVEGDSPRYGSAFPTLTRGASICRRCAAGGVVARRLSSCDQSSWDALRQGMAVRSVEGDSPRYGSAFPTLTRGASICRPFDFSSLHSARAQGGLAARLGY